MSRPTIRSPQDRLRCDAEQWGRRWITIDTSRVAITIARQRLRTAKYDYYQVTTQPAPTVGAVQHRLDGGTEGSVQAMLPTGPQSPEFGFEYKHVPHITLKNIAQNVALDPILAKHEPILDKALAACSSGAVCGGWTTRRTARRGC